MSDEVDFWSATIAAYQPLQMPTPELTPKLLKRPPFRFIHDIVCGIDARFAAYDTVVPPELRDSTQVDTKEKKIEYLTVLIQYINKIMKVELDVNPKKIVAGQEPEKTNLFLQYLAAGVGYAQQDKAAKAATTAAKSSARTSASSQGQAAAAAAAAAEVISLPDVSMLPRKRSDPAAAAARRKSYTSAAEEAQKFNKKLASYSLNLNLNEVRHIRTEGESMVRMWNELASSQTETKPSNMPEEALETAIKRQIDMIKTVEDLIKENDLVIEHLENLVT